MASTSSQPQSDEAVADDQSAPPTQQDAQNDGISLINPQGALTRRRGKATCQDIRDLPPGTRVHLEINDSGQPCNMPEATLLSSYMGILAKDSALAPISFSDWRHPAMDVYKKHMIEELEAKFSYPPHIRRWMKQSLGIKWRGYKTSLKRKYWNPNRPMREIMENVPAGVDPVQWGTLVSQWAEPCDKERAEKNTENAKQQKTPHTLGRHSTVRRQQELDTTDRLLIWRISRLKKDGSWSSEDAKAKWDMACSILAESGLKPEDGNVEENEKVFKIIMGPEHPGRVRCAGLGVSQSNYYSHGSTSAAGSSYISTGGAKYVQNLENRVEGLETQMGNLNTTMAKMFKFVKKNLNLKKKSKHHH